jgi:vitamin B12 transporter
MSVLNSVPRAPGLRSAVAVSVASAVSAILASSLSTQARAASSTLEPVVVTATRSPVPLSQLVADVTVLTRADIARAVAQDLSDLLRQQGGIEVTRNGGPGSTGSVFLRGADNRFTTLLVDGVRVDTQSGDGGAPWSSIPLAMIERIEILRGPASAVYGSDAVAGVVQVFTRQAGSEPLLELGVAGGTQGMTQADALVSGRRGAVDYLFGASTERRTGGGSVLNPASSSYNPDEDGARSHSRQGRLGWQINPQHRIELSGLHSDVDARYDAYASMADDHSLVELDSAQATWSANWLANWRSRLSLGDATQHYSTYPNAYSTSTRSRTATLQNDLQWGDHGVHVVAETRRDELVNDDLTQSALIGQAQRDVNSLALGYDLRHGGHALQLNARSDHDSDFGSHQTGSVAAAAQLPAGLRLTASAATAFRAPTLYQRFSQYGFVGLQPESSRHVEAGLSHRAGQVETAFTYYRNRVSQLIDYDFGCSCYQNVGRAVLKGATLRSSWQLDGWRLSGSLDVQSPRNEDTGEQLLRRARRHAQVQADTTVMGWDTGVQWQGSSSRADFDWDQYEAVTLRGYSTVNLTLGKALSPEWRLQFKVDNVFQRDYQTAYGYGGTARKAWLSLRWTPAQ